VDERSDDELVVAAREGDRVATEALLRRHYPRLRALCGRLTGDPSDADDACQEALVAVVRGLPRFDGRSSFATWAYRVATNTCLDELRRRRRRPLLRPPEEEFPASTDGRAPAGLDGADVGDVGDRVAARVDVDAALGQLAPEFRAAVVLRDLCQLSYEEIAHVLDVPVGTVRSRIARGRATLLSVLGGNPVTGTERRTQ
jgi:RNA polymerase sigma-70 factor (ECF subfamily)